MSEEIITSSEEIITLGDNTELIDLPPFIIEDWVYSVIPIDELQKLDGDEELKIVRYSNDNSKFVVKYNSVSGSTPIGYETIEVKSEYNWEEIDNVLTASEWVIDLSEHEFEANWINPEFEE